MTTAQIVRTACCAGAAMLIEVALATQQNAAKKAATAASEWLRKVNMAIPLFKSMALKAPMP